MRPTGTDAAREAQRLTEAQVGLLRGYARERSVPEGGYLFDENGVVDSFFVVVEGEVGISRLEGAGEVPLLTHGPGEFTGGLAVLTGRTSVHRARAVSPLRVLEIDPEAFRRLAAERPEVADVFVSGLARRMRTTQRAFRQQEKLAALGKLSAGLAHELNNPASAARRAAEELRALLPEALNDALANDVRFGEEQRAALLEMRREIEERRSPSPDPLARTEREDALARGLEVRGVEDAWELAPVLADAGAEERDLEALSDEFDAGTLAGAARWLARTLEISGLLAEVSEATGRVSELVGAVKGYTHMDRSAPGAVDVVAGIEDTLTVMGHRLGGVSVVREYGEGFPKVAGRGGELNQVWTNLVENAAEAAGGGGTVTLRVSARGGAVVVEVADDGPGIPEGIKNRVFEPFFTTREVGTGTGLGLDVVRRVVAGHGGGVTMETGPGGTTFRVSLPAGEGRT